MQEDKDNMVVRHEEAMELLKGSDLIYNEYQVHDAIVRLAKSITETLSERFPVFCCVMNGGVVLGGQLLTKLAFPLDFEYIDVSRYSKDNVGGELSWRVRPKIDLKDRVVLLVDDILDEGHTLALIKQQFLNEGAEAVYTAVLTEKELDHPKPITADFIGLTLPNRFVFGAGMDAYGYWRNLPAIYAIGRKYLREHK